MVERRKEEEMKLVRSKGVKRRKGIGDSLLSMDLLTMVDSRGGWAHFPCRRGILSEVDRITVI